MSKFCLITGRMPMSGHKRSHAMNASKRKFYLNLHYRRIWVNSMKKFISIRVSAKGIRTIDKKGIEFFLKKINKRGCRFYG